MVVEELSLPVDYHRPAKLQGVALESPLAMAAGYSFYSRNKRMRSKNSTKRSLKKQLPIDLAAGVRQDLARVGSCKNHFLKLLRATVAHQDRGNSLGLEVIQVLDKLSNLLAAEDSAEMAKKDKGCRTIFP